MISELVSGSIPSGDASFSVFSGLVVGGDGIFGVSCGCGDVGFSVFSG
jgi:hypothetical protein